MEKYVTSIQATAGIVTLTIPTEHGLSAGDYFSVRNINSTVNGQYYVLGTPSTTQLTYDISNPSYNLSSTATALAAKILYTELNEAGKPAYIYDEVSDSWYQISGKVNTNGNYSWTGTHLFQAAVTMEDLLTIDGTSIFIKNSASPSVPTGGGKLFVQDGALKYIGSSGTITTIANA